ncbi:hypothetical protein [Thalassotalea castellviae]|uniref:Uncharacterized protein n=1 Tax=Thalassotalea castellviae TaxID=3075612 RepID=A0ABU3A1S6_9GAMM|nr:hypothetical protein [Thalassotalea sp. W431]MDT0603497.1 hypothetical protein [Thalassotalea sp. W431]
MDEHRITELQTLLGKFEQARMPTTKGTIAEMMMKIVVPVLVEQDAEIRLLRSELKQCRK